MTNFFRKMFGYDYFSLPAKKKVSSETEDNEAELEDGLKKNYINFYNNMKKATEPVIIGGWSKDIHHIHYFSNSRAGRRLEIDDNNREIFAHMILFLIDHLAIDDSSLNMIIKSCSRVIDKDKDKE